MHSFFSPSKQALGKAASPNAPTTGEHWSSAISGPAKVEHSLTRLQPSPLPAAGLFGHRAPIQRMQVWIDERGKVRYHKKDKAPQGTEVIDIPDKDFASWKGAGKQKPSQKVTDPETLESYYKENGDYYKWQSGSMFRDDRKGDKITGDALTALKQKEKTLIDRSRPDRQNQDSQMYDVGPHESPHTLDDDTEYRHLQAPAKIGAERDHQPSSKSIQTAVGKSGRNIPESKQAVTINISKDLHNDASTTFGARQDYQDTEPGGATKARYRGDAANLGRAFYRDASFLIGFNKSVNTDRAERLKELGAYRFMHKLNQKFHDDDSNYGADMTGPGQIYDTSIRAKKQKTKKNFKTKPTELKEESEFTWKTDPLGRSQGRIMGDFLQKTLLDEGFAQKPQAISPAVQAPAKAAPKKKKWVPKKVTSPSPTHRMRTRSSARKRSRDEI